MKNFLTYDASRKHSLLSCLLFSALVAMLVFAIAWLRRPYDFDVDSHWYIKIAEGHISEVIKPFSNRVLHPFAAALLQKLLHLSVDTSFLVVGTLSVVVFVASTMLMATSQISFAAAAILLASPFLLGLFEDYYLPDVLHAAILSLFILCLFLRRYFLSFVCLLLLAIT